MNDLKNNIIVGIDGGGTGCRVAIATDQGQRLGDAKGGPANRIPNPSTTVYAPMKTLVPSARKIGFCASPLGTPPTNIKLTIPTETSATPAIPPYPIVSPAK